MDVIIAILNQTFSLIKQFIAAVTPMAIYVSTVVSPILKAFIIFLVSIDYVGIFTSKIFIILMLLIIAYFGGYLYLKIYKPQLYEKIIDALGLRRKLIKQPFLFAADLDFNVSSN
jgi:hypothetical protein